MLAGGELKERYSKDFILVEAEAASRLPRDSELYKLGEGRGWAPLFVFLDADGNKVLSTRGFNNVWEARVLHEFISKKQYLKTTYQEFLASFPEKG